MKTKPNLKPIDTKLIAGVALIAAFALSQQLQASTITFSSLPFIRTSFATGEEYKANWESLQAIYPTAPYGYGNANINVWDPSGSPVSNHSLVPDGSPYDIAYHYHVDFYVHPAQAGQIDFQIAPDFGLGGAAFVDGALATFSSDDLWWGEDWNNASQLLIFGGMFSSGWHSLDVYGQEAQADGYTGGRFSINDGEWETFWTNDSLSAVPEGGSTFALLSGAAMLLCTLGRRVKP